MLLLGNLKWPSSSVVILVTSIWVIISGHFDGRSCFLRVDSLMLILPKGYTGLTLKQKTAANKQNANRGKSDRFLLLDPPSWSTHVLVCDFPTVKHQLKNFVIWGWGWLPSIHIVKAVGICLNIICIPGSSIRDLKWCHPNGGHQNHPLRKVT